MMMAMVIVDGRAIDQRIQHLRRLRLSSSVAVLFAIVTAAATAAAPVAAAVNGVAGMAADALAALGCVAGASIALAVSRTLRGTTWALPALLLGMMARMAIPLALALGCLVLAPRLANAGLLCYLLIFYPLTLAVETAMAVPPRQSATSDFEAMGPAAR